MLEKWLRTKGYNVVYTREPTYYTDYPIGSLINRILERHVTVAEEAIPLLFAADRVDHTKRFIVPALKEGSIVLCDRYVFSSLAYQSRGMRVKFTKKWLKEINKYTMRPDIVFFLDIDPKEGLERLRKDQRIHDDKFFEDLDTQKRIREAYYDVFNLNEHVGEFFNLKSMPQSLLSKVKTFTIVDRIPVISIDGALPKENIHNVIREIVRRFVNYRKILPGKRRRVKPKEFLSLLQFKEE